MINVNRWNGINSPVGEEAMTVRIVLENKEENLEKFLVEACYSGERFIVKGEEGFLAAIVPMEDLEVLEEIESLK